MKESLKRFIKLVLFFGIGILFVYLSVKDMTPEDFELLKSSAAQAMQGSAWLFLVLSFFTGVTAHYIRALRSRQLLRPLGYVVRRSTSFIAVMVCYISNLAFPRLGEILRCTTLRQLERVPFEKTLGSVLTERVIDLFFLILILLTAIFMNTDLLNTLMVDTDPVTGLDISLGEKLSMVGYGLLHSYKFIVALLLFAVFCVVVYLTRAHWTKIPFFVKIKDFVVGIWQGLVAIKDLKNPMLFVVYTLTIWVLYFLQSYFTFKAFDFLSDIGLIAVFTVFAIGNIGFVVGPGGLGAYPLLAAGTLLLYGIDYSAGLAVGWVTWGVQTVMVLSVGVVALTVLSMMKKTKNNDGELSQDE